jgi:hypothetical protein
LKGQELNELVQVLHQPSLQNPEDSSEDEFDYIPHEDRVEDRVEDQVEDEAIDTASETLRAIDNQTSESPESSKRSKNNYSPHLPTPLSTISSQVNQNMSEELSQLSSNTLGSSPTLSPRSTPSETSNSKKRKRRNSEDSNVAPNREIIDSTLRTAHILPEGSTRTRKPSKKARYSSSFFIKKYWSTFVASSTTGPKTRFHQSQLPKEPRFYQDVMKLPSPHKEGFISAMHHEIKTIRRKGTYNRLPWKDLDAENNEVLPLIWVFKYKLDNEGYLKKYKARICVRGDLQSTAEETYAATLAIRCFRALMAIAAYFNMEIRHYDAVNAFTNAWLASKVYCHPPEGFSDPDYLWELNRALYGLKTSPLLWYQDLTKSLKEFGLQEVKDVPCLWQSDKLIVFFYVDDIIVLVKPGQHPALESFEKKLLSRYEIRSLGELDTFCGNSSSTQPR